MSHLSFLTFDPRKRLMWIPWSLATVDSLLTYAAGMSNDGLMMMIPYIAAYPFSILISTLSNWIGYSFIAADPIHITSEQYILWDRMVVAIFITGGAMWFFFIGLTIRKFAFWVMDTAAKQRQRN